VGALRSYLEVAGAVEGLAWVGALWSHVEVGFGSVGLGHSAVVCQVQPGLLPYFAGCAAFCKSLQRACGRPSSTCWMWRQKHPRCWPTAWQVSAHVMARGSGEGSRWASRASSLSLP